LDDDAYRARLLQHLQVLFTEQQALSAAKKSSGSSAIRLATQGFTLDQVWAQLTHHTERLNAQAITSLGRLVESEEFLRGLEGLSQSSDGEGDIGEGEEMELEIDEDGED
jgi:hypothetical protein